MILKFSKLKLRNCLEIFQKVRKSLGNLRICNCSETFAGVEKYQDEG